MKTFFLDTNVFLQCKDLNQLPWDDITEEDEVRLIIPHAVQKEIDRLKHDGNRRRAKRARKANSLMRKIINTHGMIETIKHSNPLVTIEFSPIQEIQDSISDILDLSQADDNIIAETITYKNQNPEDTVAVLTHDIILISIAKRCGLEYVEIPDGWFLEPEPDAKDKRIHALENKLKELVKSSPQITIEAQDDKGNKADSLTVSVVRYEKLTDAEIKKLMVDIQAKYPMVTVFDTKPEDPYIKKLGLANPVGIMYEYKPPSVKEIENYKKGAYPLWLHEVKEFFESLSYTLEAPHRNIELPIAINNDGNVPAENIVVEFEVTKGLLLNRSHKNDVEEENQKLDTLPSPPEAPKVQLVEKRFPFPMMGSMGSNFARVEPLFPTIPEIPKHDRNSFYWKSDNFKKWSFECDEYRHKVESEIFSTHINVSHKNNIDSGALKCRVTAKNMSEPTYYAIPIKVEYMQGNTFEQAKKLINEME